MREAPWAEPNEARGRVRYTAGVSDSANKVGLDNLLTVKEAIQLLDATPIAAPEAELVPLTAVVGRRLAEDLLTDRDYPAFDKSLMDGFAIRVGEPAGAFELIGEIAAGSAWQGPPLSGRQAIAIMTGASLPPGDGSVGVVPVEQSRREGNVVHLDTPAIHGKYVTPRGGDRAAGAAILRRGTLLGPRHIGALASVGMARVPVYQKPICAVIATGDEIVPVDADPGPVGLRDSNTPQLLAMLESFGCDAFDAGHCHDDAQATRSCLRAVLEADPAPDVLFVTGGMSMGEHDYVWRTIAELAEVRITKLKIRPGKPFVFAVRRTEIRPQFVFGLPGNPVSVFVCAQILARRVLARLGGGDPSEVAAGVVDAPLAGDLKANGPRQFYQPARLASGVVHPLTWRGSADLFTLAEANALIERGPDDPPRTAGQPVSIIPIA